MCLSTKRGLFSFPRSCACRSEQRAVRLPAVLFGKFSYPNVSSSHSAELVEALFFNPIHFVGVTSSVFLACHLPRAAGAYLPLGGGGSWDAAWHCTRSVCLSGGQIAITGFSIFHETILHFRGQLEVMVSCCLE